LPALFWLPTAVNAVTPTNTSPEQDQFVHVRLVVTASILFYFSDLPVRSLTVTCGIDYSPRGITLTVAERARAEIIGLGYGLS
jgi:hypothetical protein